MAWEDGKGGWERAVECRGCRLVGGAFHPHPPGSSQEWRRVWQSVTCSLSRRRRWPLSARCDPVRLELAQQIDKRSYPGCFDAVATHRATSVAPDFVQAREVAASHDEKRQTQLTEISRELEISKAYARTLGSAKVRCEANHTTHFQPGLQCCTPPFSDPPLPPPCPMDIATTTTHYPPFFAPHILRSSRISHRCPTDPPPPVTHLSGTR